MEKFAYTDTETLLWDYSETEEHYVLVIPPARRVKTLYRVTQVYAYQWFGLNGGNNLKIIYYPFAQTHFRNLTDPCDCPPESVDIAPNILSVSPGSGISGALLTITGQNFSSVTSVMIDGIEASFTIIDDSTILATVP